MQFQLEELLAGKLERFPLNFKTPKGCSRHSILLDFCGPREYTGINLPVFNLRSTREEEACSAGTSSFPPPDLRSLYPQSFRIVLVQDAAEHRRPVPHLARRRFLSRLTLGTLGAGVMLMVGAIFRLPFPRLRSHSDTARIGRAVDFPLHRYTFVAESNLFVYRDRQGIRVLSAVCTHLGCVVRASETGFDCPCHGSRFTPQGVPVSGPAGRPLEWYHAERSTDGTLIVDLTRRVSPHTYLKV